MLNAGDLAAIQARLANLSPGPWSIPKEHPSALVDADGEWLITGDGQGFGLVCSDFDAAFIAAARTDIPRLLVTIEGLIHDARELAQENAVLREIVSEVAKSHAIGATSLEFGSWNSLILDAAFAAHLIDKARAALQR